MNLIQAIQTYTNWVETRARNAGYEAVKAGQRRQAPMEVNEFASAWVEGWNQAALDALEAANPLAMAA